MLTVNNIFTPGQHVASTKLLQSYTLFATTYGASYKLREGTNGKRVWVFSISIIKRERNGFFFETSFLKKFAFTLFAFFVYFLIAHIFSYLYIYIICSFFLNWLCCSHVLSTTLNEYFESLLGHALFSMCQQCFVN